MGQYSQLKCIITIFNIHFNLESEIWIYHIMKIVFIITIQNSTNTTVSVQCVFNDHFNYTFQIHISNTHFKNACILWMNFQHKNRNKSNNGQMNEKNVEMFRNSYSIPPKYISYQIFFIPNIWNSGGNQVRGVL